MGKMKFSWFLKVNSGILDKHPVARKSTFANAKYLEAVFNVLSGKKEKLN